MRFSERVARSEVHLYFQKLKAKGYQKVNVSYHKGGYIVDFKRVSNNQPELLRVKFSDNGWVSYIG